METSPQKPKFLKHLHHPELHKAVPPAVFKYTEATTITSI